MKTAYLYIRVSTDEQAKKGFSISHQQDVLDYYCLINNLTVLQCFREDYSAKDFHRPEWSRLFAQCIAHKKDKPNYILFTQWSRFSRNITEAYIMIKRLHSLGIIPQAVEQPLDMNVPENKMVLANYLAAAEVENERRSLNVKVNMYKAKLEGRWVSGAPIGYRNVVSVSGQKYIAIYEPEAALLRNAFEQVCEGIFSIPQIYSMAIAKGLKCSLNNFRNILRNPLYCGRIIVHPEHNSIPVIVEGQHEKLISPVLFDKVQQVLNLKSRKRKQTSKQQLNELFPFRGLLYCPECGHKLTASSSAGRSKHYDYYHCNEKCGFRVRTEKVHQLFINRMNALQPSEQYAQLFTAIVEKIYRELSFHTYTGQSHSLRKIEEIENQITSARALLLSKDIDNKEYYQLKSDCETRIKILRTRIDNAVKSLAQLKSRVEAISTFLSIPGFAFNKADIATKKRIIMWLYGNEIIWSEICFNEQLNYNSSIVYDNNNLCNTQTEKAIIIDFDILPAAYKRVLEIGAKKGQSLTSNQAQSIATFLYDGARLAIDIFMIGELNKPEQNTV